MSVFASIICLFTLWLSGTFPGSLAQLPACTVPPDGTVTSGICSCFASQDPPASVVDCSNRQLTEVPPGFPANTAYLSLQGNSITSLSSSALRGLYHLKTLQLQDNGLRTDLIAEGAFSGLENLTSLDLSGNRILLSDVMVKSLRPLTGLKTLTLTNNNIHTIHPSAVRILDRLEKLDLTGNQLVCDCDLAWFRNWLYNTDHLDHRIMGVTCSAPQQFLRSSVTDAGFCSSGRCYSCVGDSDEDCNNKPASEQECSTNEDACQNEIRVSNGVYRIEKTCKQLQACRNNVANNVNECNNGSVNSVCRTCCQGNLCNGPASGVVDNYVLPGFPADPNFSEQTTTAPSGRSSTMQPSHFIRRRQAKNDGGLDNNLERPAPIASTVPTFTPWQSAAATSRPTTSSMTTNQSEYSTTCPEETLSDEHGQITWAETAPRKIADAACPYGYVSSPSTLASRQCTLVSDKAVWNNPDLDGCLNATAALLMLANTTVTPENAGNISSELLTLTRLPKTLTEDDITLAVDTMENIVEVAGDFGNNSEAVVENVIETVANLTGAKMEILLASQQRDESAARILHLVDELALNVRFEDAVLEATTDRVDLVIVRIEGDVEGVTLRSVLDGDGHAVPVLTLNGTDPEPNLAAQASIELPATLFADYKDMFDRLRFVIYKDVTYFEIIRKAGETRYSDERTNTPAVVNTSAGDVERDALNSVVISATVGDLDITGLNDGVKTSFVHQSPKRADNPTCVFWNSSGSGSWSSEGCHVLSSEDNRTECECDHLTNFALLMDLYGVTSSYDDGHQRALSIISYVGCGLSIIGLTLTFISYMMIRTVKMATNKKRQLRSDRRTRVLLNLLVALLLMNVFFIVDAAISESAISESASGNPGDVSCKLLGALLHFGLLTAVAWMGLEAWHMYLALVKVFDSYRSHLMKKMGAIGWGLPLVIVGVTLGVDLDHYDFYQNFCWLEVGGVVFYVTFVAPALFMLLFNAVIFCLVTNQLCSLRRRSISSSESFDGASQLRASLSITVLLGLTWALAIFMIGEAGLAFSYLFAIFNSSQGLCIFLFHCVLNEEVRLGWRTILCPQCLTLEELAKTSSGQQFSNSSRQAQLQKRLTLERTGDPNGHLNHEPIIFEEGVPKFNPFQVRPDSYPDSRI
ncbi:adhesion G-protein coupled receptor G4-like [Diadema antillarum]|uniref:adhesion G-protein coupled receptor G4-like n=1 Tax=Diadema antillarum TaxID=105358 RepID=UPI003A892625